MNEEAGETAPLVTKFCIDLQGEIERLEVFLEALERQLEPVLTPKDIMPVAEEDSEVVEDIISCELAITILGHIEQVRRLQAFVRNIKSRLAI